MTKHKQNTLWKPNVLRNATMMRWNTTPLLKLKRQVGYVKQGIEGFHQNSETAAFGD